jgi:hypothetical protein
MQQERDMKRQAPLLGLDSPRWADFRKDASVTGPLCWCWWGLPMDIVVMGLIFGIALALSVVAIATQRKVNRFDKT